VREIKTYSHKNLHTNTHSSNISNNQKVEKDQKLPPAGECVNKM
jgi:hypothetical protein